MEILLIKIALATVQTLIMKGKIVVSQIMHYKWLLCDHSGIPVGDVVNGCSCDCTITLYSGDICNDPVPCDYSDVQCMKDT